MIIPVYCNICEGHEFDVDTDKLGRPFHSDMFPVGVDCVHSRTWIFPPGPVNMELTCPGCGAFPFEFRDGVPSGRIKVRAETDKRFLELMDWHYIKTLIYLMPLNSLKPIERVETPDPLLSKTRQFKTAKPGDTWTGTVCGCTKKRSDFYDKFMQYCKVCMAQKRKEKRNSR